MEKIRLITIDANNTKDSCDISTKELPGIMLSLSNNSKFKSVIVEFPNNDLSVIEVTSHNDYMY